MMRQPQDISESIRSFLRRNLALHAGNAILRDDDNIFELGFVDSSFAMQLVVFIEETFKVIITDEDLEIANFSSVARMRTLIDSKLAAR